MKNLNKPYARGGIVLKVIGINMSPRKRENGEGSSKPSLKALEEKAPRRNSTIKDDVLAVYNILKDADVIVFASPI